MTFYYLKYYSFYPSHKFRAIVKLKTGLLYKQK